MYDDINRLMIQAGILPHIKLQAGKSDFDIQQQRPSATTSIKESPTVSATDDSGIVGDVAAASDQQEERVVDDMPIPELPDFVGDNSVKIAPRPNDSSFGADITRLGGNASKQMNAAPATQSHGGYAMTATPGMNPHHDDTDEYGTSGGYGGGYGGDTTDGYNSNSGGGAGTGGYNGSSGGATGGYNGGGGGSTKNGFQSNYHHQSAGMPASQIDHVLSGYFGTPITPGTPSSSDDSSIAGQAAGTPHHLGHSEIISALSSVQQQPEYLNPTELKFDSSAIKQAVISTIAKESGGAVTKRINQIAEKTIDFIEMVFDAIIEDDAISDTIKALLLRLQIPVIKASMLDQEFFIYDDHPARVLLDKITETGIGVTERDNEIYIALDNIVHKLVTDYDLQTSSFKTALDELEIISMNLTKNHAPKKKKSRIRY